MTLRSLLSTRWPHLIGVLACTFTTGLLAAPPSLRDALTPEEFERAGLGKLSSDELAFLSARVTARSSSAAAVGVAEARTTAGEPVTAAASQPATPPPRGEAAFGREQEVQRVAVQAASAPKEIQSRIAGPFNGWSGRTTFTLANGQVWQQADPGEFVLNADAPEVVIRRGAFGAYYLRVGGYGTQVKVKRLK